MTATVAMPTEVGIYCPACYISADQKAENLGNDIGDTILDKISKHCQQNQN